MTRLPQRIRPKWAGMAAPSSALDARPDDRWKVFIAVFLIVGLIGTVFVYSRPPVYRAVASVLTVKPKAIDARSAAADLEHVTIQKRLLLGERLLDRVAQRLAERDKTTFADQNWLRERLAVVMIPATNLLELRAEGRDPESLQRIVNVWTDSYEAFRAEEIAAATGRTIMELEDRQLRLADQIETARAEIRRFRDEHDIVSGEREENPGISTLKGLNSSLSKARERLVEAQAGRKAIDAAIDKGETVVPAEKEAELASLRREVNRLRGRLSQLELRYTREYIALHPNYRDLPEQLARAEAELRRAIERGRIAMRDQARRAVATAEETVAVLEAKLIDQQGRARIFTQRAEELAALEAQLARLEGLYADNRERLASIQIQNLARFPPIQVIERAPLPNRPIHPDYHRDLLIALAAALVVALFATWLVDYLNGRARPLGLFLVGQRDSTEPQPPPLDLQASEKTLGPPVKPSRQIAARDAEQPSEGAEPLPRELTVDEIAALLAQTDPVLTGCCALLLSGVAPGELTILGPSGLDRVRRVLSVPGDWSRDIAVPASTWDILEPLLDAMAKHTPCSSLQHLDDQLCAAAMAAGLAEPDRVTVLAIWHTYVVYLVRQGIAFGPLQERVGGIPPDIQIALQAYSPRRLDMAGQGEIDWVYPVKGAHEKL